MSLSHCNVVYTVMTITICFIFYITGAHNILSSHYFFQWARHVAYLAAEWSVNGRTHHRRLSRDRIFHGSNPSRDLSRFKVSITIYLHFFLPFPLDIRKSYTVQIQQSTSISNFCSRCLSNSSLVFHTFLENRGMSGLSTVCVLLLRDLRPFDSCSGGLHNYNGSIVWHCQSSLWNNSSMCVRSSCHVASTA